MSGTALLIGLALLLANGLFVAAEFALIAARRSRIEQLAGEGSGSARHALAGLRELSLMLAGAQLGITMASLGLGAIAEPALHAGLDALLAETAIPRPVSAVLSLVVALGIVVFLHMVVGEMAPKTWAISDPVRAVLLLARPFRWFVAVFRPFIRLLNAGSNTVVRACGVEPQDELATAHAPGDLAMLLEESARQGTLAADQGALLTRAIDLSGLDAEAAMIPRRDVVSVHGTDGLDAVESTARASGRSRLPVAEGDLDQPLGILHVKDALTVPEDERHRRTARSIARPAMLVPESRPLENLLVDMRARRQHVGLVVDEHGSVTGLIALEDVLEELIGEFSDESDRLPPAQQRADGSYVVPGSLRPDELAAQLGVRLPEGEWETVAGYLISVLDRLPTVGDRVRMDTADLEVAHMEGHRVTEVAVLPRR